jgi:acyl-CoA dehydrogenase
MATVFAPSTSASCNADNPESAMDFELSLELRMLRDNLRRYVYKEMIPIERETTTEEEELKPEARVRFEKGMKDLGLWMFDIPEEYGGLGLNALACCIVREELARTIALPARHSEITGPKVRAILYECTDEQKERFLFPVLRGEKRSCFAQTEPDAGSDPGSMRTTAVLDGDHYIINGAKRFISGAKSADFMQLMASTDRSKRSRGVSCFLVDMDTPGVSVSGGQATMMGDRIYEIFLDNVRVPTSNRIGVEGQGSALAQRWLTIGRLLHGARALGVAERCLEMAATYAKQRVTFGKPLSERQAIQFMLVDSYIDIRAARLLVWDAACKIDNGQDAKSDCHIAKAFADEMAFKVADRCMQIHGGMGLTKDLPIERFWRQQRSYRITEGATEVMKMAIARHVLNQY